MGLAAGFSTVLSVAAGLAGGTLIGCNGVSAILAVPVLRGGAVLGLGVVPGAAVAAGAEAVAAVLFLPGTKVGTFCDAPVGVSTSTCCVLPAGLATGGVMRLSSRQALNTKPATTTNNKASSIQNTLAVVLMRLRAGLAVALSAAVRWVPG